MRRIKRRSAAIFALAAAGALAVAGIAMGSGSSTVTLNVTPVDLANPGFTNATLFIHTHTNYTNPGNANPGGATQRAQLYFDDDFRFNTNAVPKCDPNSISGITITLQQAQAQCGTSLIGKGRAVAIYDPPPAGGATNEVQACVRVFNGNGSGTPNKDILLFTRAKVGVPPNNTIADCNPNGTQGNSSILLAADLKANPSDIPGTTADADFVDADNCSPTSGAVNGQRLGCQADFNNIPASSPFPLADFDVQVNPPGIQGGTSRTGFTSARCKDTNEPLAARLDLRVKFTYNGGTPLSETKPSAADCT